MIQRKATVGKVRLLVRLRMASYGLYRFLLKASGRDLTEFRSIFRNCQERRGKSDKGTTVASGYHKAIHAITICCGEALA